MVSRKGSFLLESLMVSQRITERPLKPSQGEIVILGPGNCKVPDTITLRAFNMEPLRTRLCKERNRKMVPLLVPC